MKQCQLIRGLYKPQGETGLLVDACGDVGSCAVMRVEIQMLEIRINGVGRRKRRLSKACREETIESLNKHLLDIWLEADMRPRQGLSLASR